MKVFLDGPTLASFCLFLFFFKSKFDRKTVGFSGIQNESSG